MYFSTLFFLNVYSAFLKNVYLHTCLVCLVVRRGNGVTGGYKPLMEARNLNTGPLQEQ